jgi:integrase
MDYLRLEEIPAYLDACWQAYRPLAEVLLGTGLRTSEALALEWGDVDWRSSAVVAVRARKRNMTGSTKGDRARRVEIGPRLLGVLADRRAARAEHSLGDDGGSLVFPGQRGYLDRSYVSRTWHREALKGAGLRQTVRLHDLRHSAAAGWLAAGLPMIYVQRQLGHSNIGTTIDLYGHLEESFLRDAAARAEAAVWRVGTTAGTTGSGGARPLSAIADGERL